MRRALESCQFCILSVILCWSHLELKEKTELWLISLKQQMLLHVCVCALCQCVYPPVSTSVSMCVRLIDMLLICWGLPFRPDAVSVYS